LSVPENPYAKPFFFSPENEAKIETILARYPAGRQASAILPLLDLAQRQCGNWLPPTALAAVAARLDMPLVKATEVATFYTMFNLKPVGRYFLQFCRTTPCWLKGSEGILRAACDKLGIHPGQTTQDGLFTIKEVECLGACAGAPVVQINDDLYEKLTPDLMRALLDDLKAGREPKLAPATARLCGGACACGSGKGEPSC